MGGISRLCATLVGIWLAALSPAHAQTDAASADTDHQKPCELHVWPGNGLGSVYHGWLHGGIVNGAVQGREGYKAMNANPLATADQRALLATLPLASWLGLPDHQLVLHDESLDSRTMRSTSGRIRPDGSICYAEFMIDDLIFQEDVVTGRFLKILFRFRDFGSEQTARRSFGTWTMTKLTQFPPQTAEAEGAALTDLKSAFQQDVEQFGEYLRRPVRTRN
ncbi:hypothetical protein E5554_18140 [Sphingobium sp. PAMC28499]|jgi:hypothetical protein|uniref:hypothetical protein n=1 Tax=Sphingobium sp. PAMC28499 TaxID=2565554 RepID=UPI00109DC032|nr:hypothetical protein [Sphingobium sp. PAMC28499]QCB39574.1 hypothetical protein E5554_18140 [Sphingobium sp. PAMC28499]